MGYYRLTRLMDPVRMAVMPRFTSERAERQKVEIMEAVVGGEERMHEDAIHKATSIGSPRLGDHILKLLKDERLLLDHYFLPRKDGSPGKSVAYFKASIKGKRWLERNKPADKPKTIKDDEPTPEPPDDRCKAFYKDYPKIRCTFKEGHSATIHQCGGTEWDVE